MVRQLSADGSLTPDVAAHIMTSALHALQLHGQHETNLGSLLVLGAQLYEILRPLFPNIIEVRAACVSASAHRIVLLVPACTASVLGEQTAQNFVTDNMTVLPDSVVVLSA
jgi:hypothetical protein